MPARLINGLPCKVSGVGVNDSDYQTQRMVEGKIEVCPFYRRWQNMLNRCYGKTSASRLPAYEGCSVSDEWLTFSKFKTWMELQQWEAMELDKDILSKGNKVYSKETCRFVPSQINSLLSINQAVRGDEPLGVRKRKDTISNRYSAQLQVLCPEKGRYYKNIGTFNDKLIAHRAWQMEKSRQIELVVNLYAQHENFIPEVANALIERAWKLKVDSVSLIETVFL